jgi:hypothetical protein
MAGQAVLKQSDALLVVRLLLKLQGPAVLHEFFELVRVSFGELLERRLDLLLLDGGVLFILGPTGQSLPGKTSL